jgi:hypothetical protein
MPDNALTRLLDYGNNLVTSLAERVKTERVTRFGPVNATGNLAASLRCEVEETATGYRLSVYAASYALTLEYGRRPGKFPPLRSIQLWIEARGLQQRPGGASVTAGRGGYSSLAYLIGRKIAQNGTTIYQQGQPTGLFGLKIGPEIAATELAKVLLPVVREQVTTALRMAA